MPKTEPQPADYIVPLNMNGLEGRMLRLPAKSKSAHREILFIYGQHSSLERWWGLVQHLNKFGAVTMPDLPGFGGMNSLYKIGQPPTIDNLADYLASFIKLRYKHKKVTILAMSLGFVIVTRMFQRYPDLIDKVDMLVSVVGFAHHDDFIYSKKRQTIYRILTRIYSGRIVAAIYQNFFLRPALIRRFYHHAYNAREKFAHLSGDEFKRTMDTEIWLWQINDLRTQMKTNLEMFKLNNCDRRVNLPVWHVASKKDRYFDHNRVEEHMRLIFTDFKIFFTKDPNHAPTIIADAKAAAPFVPPGLYKLLSQQPK